MEEKLLQVALHLDESQVKVAVGEHVVAGLSSGFGLDGAVRRHGEGAHPSLHAGDVGVDLAEELREGALQFVIQKSQIMADAS